MTVKATATTRILRRCASVLAIVAVTMVGLATTAFAGSAQQGVVAVCVTDSTGANVVLGSNKAWYQVGSGSISYVGPVGNSGCRESSFAAGSVVDVWVGVDVTQSGRKKATVVAGRTAVVNFSTTKVTIQYPDQVAFGGSEGASMWFKQNAAPASRELLSDGIAATVFRLNTSAGYVAVPVIWPAAESAGQEAVFSLAAMRVLRNDRTGLKGATATYPVGEDGTQVSKSTNDRGLVGWAMPGRVGSVAVTANANGTTRTQTFDVSRTGLLTFQTTNMTVNYPGSAAYIAGDVAHPVTEPMELFPGTYPFRFRSESAAADPRIVDTQADITVPAAGLGPITKSVVVVRFHDSAGAGLLGSVSYRDTAWHDGVVETTGTVPTDAAAGSPLALGSVAVVLDGSPTDIALALTYQGVRQELPPQNIRTDARADFSTADVTVQMTDAAGGAVDAGPAWFFSDAWHPIGASTAGAVHVELLPGTYGFAMDDAAGVRHEVPNQVIADAGGRITFIASVPAAEDPVAPPDPNPAPPAPPAPPVPAPPAPDPAPPVPAPPAPDPAPPAPDPAPPAPPAPDPPPPAPAPAPPAPPVQPAPAASPQASPQTVATDRSTVRQNETIQVAVTWAADESSIDVWLHSEPLHIGTFPVVNGRATIPLRIPADFPAGDHTLVIRGVDSGVSTQVPVVVLPASAPAGGPMAVLAADKIVTRTSAPHRPTGLAAGADAAAKPARPAAHLAETGVPAEDLAGLGAAMVLVGWFLIRVGRRRQPA